MSAAFDFDPAIVDAVHNLVTENDVAIGWLTTWGPNSKAFVEQAFDGKLAGGYVLAKIPARYRGAVPANWKFAGLKARLAVTGQRFVWVDDEVIDMEVAGNPNFTATDVSATEGLLMRTKSEIGLTMLQVEFIREFVRS